jgi:hypothetical protein
MVEMSAAPRQMFSNISNMIEQRYSSRFFHMVGGFLLVSDR